MLLVLWSKKDDMAGHLRIRICFANPELAKNSNVRDYATINELTVLSNLESHNAQMIREGKDKTERFEILKEIAEYQTRILSEAENISKQIGNGEQELSVGDGYEGLEQRR